MNNINVYSDVLNAGLIEPEKKRYTISDVKRFIKAGYDPITARFIVVCNAVYYNCYNVSKVVLNYNSFRKSDLYKKSI